MITSFALSALLDVSEPDDPAGAVADELGARGVTVPDDWPEAYREDHLDADPLMGVPLHAHVAAALRSRGVDPTEGDGHGHVVRRAVVAAFDPGDVETHAGAVDAVAAARELGAVAVLANCDAPERARRAIRRSVLDPDAFDDVVTSLGCGWQKPHEGAFRAVADRLGGTVGELVHVGDDPVVDGGAADAGATVLLTTGTPLGDVPRVLRDHR